jgi:transcriptional regulator with GAF, ATPase, and Fis domain
MAKSSHGTLRARLLARRYYLEMEDPVRSAKLLADLSARFSGIPTEQVDDEIDRALELVVGLLETDRCTFVELLPEAGAIAVTHSWARPGVTPAAVSTLVSGFHWYHDRLSRGETVRLERLPDELPTEAVAERAFVAGLPTRSHVSVPLRVEGRFVCALITATVESYRSWSAADIEHLQIVGHILANAIHRRRLERELQDSIDEIRRLQRRFEAENAYLQEEIGKPLGFEEIVGRSRTLRAVLEQAAQVASTSTTVLLLGETGTGKELLARAIHARSRRRERPLIKVNCAALPPSLVESELFGHEKGAFTGAISSKPGRFELSDGGTLFLDEVGEIPPEVQVKLLRVLEDGEFERVGGTRSRKVDVRLIAATNRDLERAIAEGRFREDLYYRLSAFPIRLPALRDRQEDVPLLVWDLIQRRQDKLGRRIDRVPERVMQALSHYAWPGNVRELGNVIERALILSSGSVLSVDTAFAASAARGEPLERVDEVERAHFLHILERCHWRISGAGNAAETLGLRPSTLRSRLKKLGITRPTAPP